MEIRLPLDGSFGNKFPLANNRCGVMATWSCKLLRKMKFLRFCRKMTPYGEIFKILLWKDLLQHRSTCCVHISWNSADRKW